MKTKQFTLKLAILITVIMGSSSCTSFYNANSSIEPIVFTKPIYKDSISTYTYIGGKFNRTSFNDFEGLTDLSDLTESYFGQFNISQTITEKYYNISFGAFAYAGGIGISDGMSNNNDITLVDYKNFFGSGLSADFQFSYPIQNLVIRPYGLRGSILYEMGEFEKYKRDDLNALGLTPDKLLTNLSQTFGLDYKFKKSSLSFNISAGYLISIPNMIIDFGYSTNLMFATKKLNIYVQKSGTTYKRSEDIVVGLNFYLNRK